MLLLMVREIQPLIVTFCDFLGFNAILASVLREKILSYGLANAGATY